MDERLEKYNLVHNLDQCRAIEVSVGRGLVFVHSGKKGALVALWEADTGN